MLVDNPLISDKRVEKEARALHGAGFELTLIAMKESGLDEMTQIDADIPVERKIGDWIKRPASISFNTQLDQLTSDLSQKAFDIVYCHDYLTIPIGYAMKQMNPKVKLIYDCHEYLKGWPLYKELPSLWKQFKGFLMWRYMLHLEKKGFSVCDGVVCTSDLIAVRLQADHQLSTTPTVVQNIPDEQPTQRLATKALLGLDEDVFLVVHAGTMYFSENYLWSIITSFEEHQGTHLVFVGDRPAFYQLREKCERKQLEHIHFIEYTDFNLMNLLAGCDAGLAYVRADEYINHNLASSNKFMEYIKAGIPVISVEQAMNRRFNKQLECAVFFKTDDPASFDKALVQIQEEAPRLIKNLKNEHRILSWENESKKLLNLMNDVSGQAIKNHSK